MSRLILLLFLFVFTFAIKLKDGSYKSHWHILVVCDQMKNDVRFGYVSWKMCDFVLLPLFDFTLVIKLRNFDFNSH